MLVRMEGNQTIISTPPDQKKGNEQQDIKPFTFDKSYWSADKNDPRYADQQTVYNDVGEELLDHAFDGYNCCIFACGYYILIFLFNGGFFFCPCWVLGAIRLCFCKSFFSICKRFNSVEKRVGL